MWIAFRVTKLITCDPSLQVYTRYTPGRSSAMEENPQQTQPKPSYEPKFMLSGHTMSVSSVKFSPDGATLASAGELRFLTMACALSLSSRRRCKRC